MAFRKFGGVERHPTNNYVSSNTTNTTNANITRGLGEYNTKIISRSHIDLQGQTMFNVGNIVFTNGESLDQIIAVVLFPYVAFHDTVPH